LLGRYLRRLGERCADAGIPEPTIMQSNGGLIDLARAAEHAAWTVLSGPAGGAAGAAFVARTAGVEDVLCFDMGGTSCDVCVVDDGAVQEQSAAVLADRPLALPTLAIHTVGAGGGSIAWADPGGALRVGPRSAGAEPGPACYGRGGTEPTVTDANLVLGYLDAGAPLAGGVELHLPAAERAIGDLARALGLRAAACAEGILRVANAEMVRALRVVTVERGIDPRGYALMAFGGAGGLHATAIAEELGISEVLCPRASGVLAALGLVVSPRRRDAQRTVLATGDELSAVTVARVAAELGEQARGELGETGAELTATYELRYRGQAFELPIAAGLEPTIETLREAFEAEHERRYGYADAEQGLELVTVRVTAIIPGVDVRLGAGGSSPPQRGRRRAIIQGEAIEFDVIGGEPVTGTQIAGPAIVALPESTLLVTPGWAGEVDDTGTVRIARETVGSTGAESAGGRFS
jgi:N-methylhydantoinase A